MSAAGLIGIITKAATNIVSFLTFVMWFYSWIIALQDYYSCFRLLFRVFSYLLSCFRRIIFQALSLVSYLLFSSWKRNRYNQYRSDTENISASTGNATFHDENGNNRISREDVELVMDKLGLYDDQFWPKEINIVNLFDEREASLNEVREAFDVFDENRDGFIDVKELKKVMSSIGLSRFCEQEFRKMIMVFDENGDGRIDVGEFVKIMEDCCINY